MKGRYSGCNMNIYSSILPGAVSINNSARKTNISHQAKLRLAWIDWYNSHGQNAQKTCRHYGISKRTFYKWKSHFKPYDLTSLEDESKRPNKIRQPQNPWQVIELIKILRSHFPTWSKDKLSILFQEYPSFSKLELLVKTIDNYQDKIKGLELINQISNIPTHKLFLSSSTIGRIISRKQLFFAKHTKKVFSSKRAKIERKRADKSLKDTAPGILIQIDTKHLNTTYGKKYYQFTAIDCFTRVKFARCYSSCSSLTAKKFLLDALEKFPFSINNVQTDNGSEYLKHFHQALKEIKDDEIDHYFSHPRCPQENSRVERVIRTDKYEFYLNGNLYPDLKKQNEKLDQWNYIYNHLRPHESLDNLTPMEYYEKVKSELIDNDQLTRKEFKVNNIPVFVINHSQRVKAFTM
jgi:putative transposase